jgi:hypothetical protein
VPPRRRISSSPNGTNYKAKQGEGTLQAETPV